MEIEREIERKSLAERINFREYYDVIGPASPRRLIKEPKQMFYSPRKNRLDPADGRYWD